MMEHTVSAGVGYRRGRYRVDLAFQYDIPAERRVGASALQAGEYSNSRTEVSLYWLAIGTSIEF
jgi:hypothetical protein